MLHNVVVHLHNEQPLMADLPARPNATDSCLICTNVRTMNGKRPVFAEDSRSTFMFPMAAIRFVEIRPGTRETFGDEEMAAATEAEGLPGTQMAEVPEAPEAAAESSPAGDDGVGAADQAGPWTEQPAAPLTDDDLVRRVRDA